MTIVRLGLISTRDGARIHLAIHGQIADNHARGIIHEVTRFVGLDRSLLCRRCFTPDRIGRAQQALAGVRGIAGELIRGLLAELVDEQRTPGEVAQVEALAAAIRETLRLAPAIQAQSPVRRVDSWQAARRAARDAALVKLSA